MTIAKEPDSAIGIFEDIALSANQLYSDEPPLETELHLEQMMLLIKCLLWLWRDRRDFYAVGNLSIYYNPDQLKSRDFRGPDFFVVLETERKVRTSWVVWEENYKYPNVILEILSPTTAHIDKGLKKELYQNTFRTPEYFWFDPVTLEFAGFRLVSGEYEPIEPDAQRHLWSEQLSLYLGLQEGFVRFFTADGQLAPTPEESSAELEQRLTQSKQQLTQSEQRAAVFEQRAVVFEQRAAQLEQQLAQETLMRELAEQQAALDKQRVTQIEIKMASWVAKLHEINIDPDSI
jgi:Uma2 family endonuclease